MTESADLVVGGFEFVDHGVHRADHEGVFGEVLRGHVVVGHRGVVLVELGHAEHSEGRQDVLAHGSPHGPVDGVPECLLIGLRHQHLTHESPVAAVGRPAAAGGAFEDRIPVGRDILGVQVQAHRKVAPLAGQFEGFRAGAEPGYSDRWVGFLVGLDVAPHQTFEHRRNTVGVPVLSAMFPGLVFGPDPQHDFESFAGHLAILAILAVHVIECPVSWDTAGSDAQHEAALCQVIEIRYAMGKFDRVMIGQQVRAGCELDLLGTQQRLGQQ